MFLGKEEKFHIEAAVDQTDGRNVQVERQVNFYSQRIQPSLPGATAHNLIAVILCSPFQLPSAP